MNQRKEGEIMNLSHCPHCGLQSYEILRTHSHCLECRYFPEQSEVAIDWYKAEFQQHRKRRSRVTSDVETIPGYSLIHGLVL